MASNGEQFTIGTRPIVLAFDNGTYTIKVDRSQLEDIHDQGFLDEIQKRCMNGDRIIWIELPTGSESGNRLREWLNYERFLYEAGHFKEIEISRSLATSDDVIDAYNLAAYLGMETWLNSLVDTLMTFDLEEEELLTHYKEDLRCYGYDEMKDLLLTTMAVHARDEGISSEVWHAELRSGSDFAINLIEKMASIGVESLDQMLSSNKCLWHVHEYRYPCP